MPASVNVHPSSFRDPSGFMFAKDGILYRQVNRSFQPDYDRLISSGLYQFLSAGKMLVAHEEISQDLTSDGNYYKTLRPEPLPFISYPYEWSFGMLKDAALLTLQLARESMKRGMMLRDATPFNIQFRDNRPVFIDTLSFGIYEEQKPWVAYRQFCETMLAPLLLAHYLGQPVNPLMLAYPEGIPLKLVAAALPRSTKWSLHSYLHIHLHAKTGSQNKKRKSQSFNAKKMGNILSSLEILVKKCRPPATGTAWESYYDEAGDRNGYLQKKIGIIQGWISHLTFRSATDLGTNTGRFAEMLAEKCGNCLAIDSDAHCIDRLYAGKKAGIVPLVADLSNPSPATGLNNEERSAVISRLRNRELVLALALTHHLALGKNIPLDRVADLFTRIAGRYLVIEFVPKQDPMAQLLFKNRPDIFPSYHKEAFETAFSASFNMLEKREAGGEGRIIYLMERKAIN